ncbi:MAG: hypothetical protein HYZ23_05265, partial [Chloroflexi bacterium]|nr:hypothetical protein [Chloroflexota bacterium]
TMLNNAWWETTINNDVSAKAPNGHYYYRLEAVRPAEGKGWQAFKVRATGYVMTGQKEEWSVGMVGALASINDIKIVYPEFSGTQLGSTMTYNGDWQAYFYIPSNVQRLEIWDGDFDRGTSAILDTDDPNTEGKPDWAAISAVNERAGGAGIPNDDNPLPAFRVSPSVTYEVLDPLGQPIYVNNDPSGTEEWERYIISAESGENPDYPTGNALKAGMYTIHITGLDLGNTVWLAVNYPICDPNGGCPPPPWSEALCPRTIGYWKNNVKKIYIDNKTKGVQETKDSLDTGLRYVSLTSKLYRSGLDVNNPSAIDSPTPLTPEEASAILQKANGNSMLDRALQQNLATWMNLATGKIGANAQIEITGITGGDFSGTMMEALRWAEDVILDPAKRSDPVLLERAKDIADMINNNALTTDATENNDSGACNTDKSAPKDKQPPSHDKLPKGPRPNADPVTPAPEPVCKAGNTYSVENTTNNPFYSVKFNFTSGTEVKGGGYDTFEYTLPADVVQAMTSMRVEVKAATDSRTYDLVCDFANPLGCGGEPASDELYAVSFNGATDNGDGTYTLTFTVYVKGSHGLSHVSFGLPEGQTAGGLNGNYTSEACTP